MYLVTLKNTVHMSHVTCDLLLALGGVIAYIVPEPLLKPERGLPRIHIIRTCYSILSENSVRQSCGLVYGLAIDN